MYVRQTKVNDTRDNHTNQLHTYKTSTDNMTTSLSKYFTGFKISTATVFKVQQQWTKMVRSILHCVANPYSKYGTLCAVTQRYAVYQTGLC